jgi:hypothetical protein
VRARREKCCVSAKLGAAAQRDNQPLLQTAEKIRNQILGL